MKKSVLFFTISLLFATSCVSPKIHNALVSENENNRTNLTQKEKEVLKLSDEVEELTLNLNLLKDMVMVLQQFLRVEDCLSGVVELNTILDILH